MLASRHPHLPPQLEQNLLFTLSDGLAADAPFPGRSSSQRPSQKSWRIRPRSKDQGPRDRIGLTAEAGAGVSPPSGPTPLVGFPPPGLRGRPVRATVS